LGRRWTAFLVALAGSVLLAVGFGIGIGLLAGAARQPPHLRTVPPAALARAGVTLGAADQPPYCDAERTAAERHLVSNGLAGCAITAAEARDALLPSFQSSVTESVLARVSGPAVSGIGDGRLVWVVVVQSSLLVLPTTACGPPRANGPACAAPRMGQVSTQAIVFVDGSSGQVLTTLPVPASAQGAATG
jgi:hypothetical protein